MKKINRDNVSLFFTQSGTVLRIVVKLELFERSKSEEAQNSARLNLQSYHFERIRFGKDGNLEDMSLSSASCIFGIVLADQLFEVNAGHIAVESIEFRTFALW